MSIYTFCMNRIIKATYEKMRNDFFFFFYIIKAGEPGLNNFRINEN